MLDKIKRWFTRSSEFDESTMEDILTGKSLNSSSISRKEAMNIPAVATAVNFIANTIAGLPVKLYKITEDGSIEEEEDDYRLKLLNEETGDLLNAQEMKYAMVVDYLLEGNAYVAILKRGNTIKSLNYVDNMYVSVVPSTNPVKKDVHIYINGQEYRDFNVMRLLKNTQDGATGIGALEQNPLIFNTMYNALKYENNCISYGTKKGFLKSKYRLDNDMLTSLKQAWNKLYSTDVNSNPDVMVLNEGISFESAASNAVENQLDESKQTNTELVYSIFGLPSILFSNNRDLSSDVYITTIKSGILPVIAAMNVMLNKFMLLESEKKSYFFAFDTSDILKADISERYDSYDIALKSGWLQVDEVRKRENLAPLGLDFVKMNLADAMYYPKTKEIYIANTNAMSKIGEGGSNINNTNGKEDGNNENPDQKQE